MRIAIVGGGAAGMMASATLVEVRPDARVVLFERNPRLGAKVIISGGGRCNVTTGVLDVREALSRYPRGARWLRHALHSFPPRAVIDWFEAHGVPLKVEDDLRVFPLSDSGRDVVGAFERVFDRGGVEVRLRSTVQGIERTVAGFAVTMPRGGAPGAAAERDDPVMTDERPGGADRRPSHTEEFEAVVITTGGAAFQHTGSRGDGYRFATALGHTVTPLFPSLNAYVVREAWVSRLAGVSLSDAALEIRAPSGSAYRFRGPFLFTHVGVTGPAVFALCSLAATEPYDEEHPLALRVNLLPDRSPDGIDELLRERFGALGGRAAANVLDTLLPRSLCPLLCELGGVDPAAHAAYVGRAARRALAGLVGALPLSIVGRRNGEEFVTAGGVSLDEVDPRTMQSRLVPGLFFAGEILDVDGFTGGYNLQAAWSTGRLSGLQVAGPS